MLDPIIYPADEVEIRPSPEVLRLADQFFMAIGLIAILVLAVSSRVT